MIKKSILWIVMFTLLMMTVSALKTIDDYQNTEIFEELKYNYQIGQSAFVLYNPGIDIPILNFDLDFIEICGTVNSYQIKIEDTCQRTIKTPVYEQQNICYGKDSILGAIGCYNKSIVTHYTEEIVNYPCLKDTNVIKTGKHIYHIKGDITHAQCDDGFGYKIDWIPKLNIVGKEFTRPEWAWWNNTYNLRREINITGADSILSDYPVLFNLTDTTNMGDGYDVKFINGDCDSGNTPLQHELINFATNNALFHIRIPSLNPGINSICMYYNNTDITTDQTTKQTWNENYVGVYHFSEGTGFNVEDSSQRYLNGSLSTNTRWNTTGLLHNAFDYDGENDVTTFSSRILPSGTRDFSIGFWYYSAEGHGDNVVRSLLCEADLSGVSNTNWCVFSDNRGGTGQTKALRFIVSDGSGQSALNIDNFFNEAHPVWHYVVVSRDNQRFTVYKDGQIVGDKNATGVSGNVNTAPRTTTIAGSDIGIENYWMGMIDEIHFYNRTITHAEVNYTYQHYLNQDDYIEFFIEQEGEPVNNPPNISINSWVEDVIRVGDIPQYQFNITEPDNSKFNYTVLWYIDSLLVKNTTYLNQSNGFFSDSLTGITLSAGEDILINITAEETGLFSSIEDSNTVLEATSGNELIADAILEVEDTFNEGWLLLFMIVMTIFCLVISKKVAIMGVFAGFMHILYGLHLVNYFMDETFIMGIMFVYMIGTSVFWYAWTKRKL